MSTPAVPNDALVDLIGPDISAYAEGNTDIPYVWAFDGAEPGPTVMVSAVVHGNEPCGSVALDWLLRETVRPVRGRLVLAFMNWRAALAFDPADPTTTRWLDEDFNRLWAPGALDEGESWERARAREVRPLVAEADYLLDIHSMQRPSPPMMMAGWLDRSVDLARKVAVPKLIVRDHGHAAGMRMRDHGRFGEPGHDAAALLVECGQHWDRAAGALAEEVTARFLEATGTVSGLMERLDRDTRVPQEVWEVTQPVTIEAERYAHARNFRGGEVIAEKGTLLGHDGDREVLTPHDDCMLVMPSARLWQGMTAVRLAQRAE